MFIILSVLHLIALPIIPYVLSDVSVYNKSNVLVKHFIDERAGFGPSFPSKGLKGYVTLTIPGNACQKVASPPNITLADYHWIALIPRTRGNDSCEFALKVKNAQDANFSAVIIYNYQDELITMGPSGKDVNIPATLITKTNGLFIISHYLYNATPNNSSQLYYITITNEQTLNFGVYLIPTIIVISTFFLVLIGFMLVKCYLQRRRTRRLRLPRSALKTLKTKKFVKGDPWETCAICLDDYEDGVKLRILPCDHAYHMKCIDRWLLNNGRQCPVCKRYVFRNNDLSEEEDNSNEEQRTLTTERTPLIQPNNNADPSSLSINNLFGHRTLNTYYMTNSNTMLPSDEYYDDNNDDSEAALSRITETTSNRTTNDLVFNQSSSNIGQYGSSNEPCTAQTAKFFIGSMGYTTDNTNASANSVFEDVDDTDDEHMGTNRINSSENEAFMDSTNASPVTRQMHL